MHAELWRVQRPLLFPELCLLCWYGLLRSVQYSRLCSRERHRSLLFRTSIARTSTAWPLGARQVCQRRASEVWVSISCV